MADPLFLTHPLQYPQYCPSYGQYPVKMNVYENEPSTSFDHVQNVEVTPDIDQFYSSKPTIKKEIISGSPSSERPTPLDPEHYRGPRLGLAEDFACTECNQRFKNYRSFAQHEEKFHSDKGARRNGISYRCKLCDSDCCTENGLKAHRCERPAPTKRHTCEYCNKSFSNSAYFSLHLKMHTEGSSHCCEICNKYFVNSSNYKIHLRSHDGDKPFKCSECDKGFLTSTNLSTHMRTHTGQRPFKCDHCSKTFINSSNLNIHRNYHKGLKSYHCKICTKTFLTSSNLKVHVRIHTGEKPYRCFVCEKAFVTSSNLNLHIKSHKGNVNTEDSRPA